tara:strand:- start:1796 stop:2008 length:213 start_codon:yes stop_codon:yes gene_type:complete
MKYVCLDIDSCGFVKNVSLDQLTKFDLNNPYKTCEECNSLMVLTSSKRKETNNDFTFTSNTYQQKKRTNK